jgi:putative oxidoreductase
MRPDLQNKWMEAELGAFDEGTHPSSSAPATRSPIGTLWDYLYLAARVAISLLFALHGAQKLFGLFGGGTPSHNPTILALGILEFVGGVCLALGTYTRVVSLVLFSETAWLYFKLCIGGVPWPIPKDGEFLAALCFFFLFLAAFGPGTISFDVQRKRK